MSKCLRNILGNRMCVKQSRERHSTYMDSEKCWQQLEEEAVQADRKNCWHCSTGGGGSSGGEEELLTLFDLRRRLFRWAVRTADTVQLENEVVQAGSNNCWHCSTWEGGSSGEQEKLLTLFNLRRQFRRAVRTADTVQLAEEAVQGRPSRSFHMKLMTLFLEGTTHISKCRQCVRTCTTISHAKTFPQQTLTILPCTTPISQVMLSTFLHYFTQVYEITRNVPIEMF